MILRCFGLIFHLLVADGPGARADDGRDRARLTLQGLTNQCLNDGALFRHLKFFAAIGDRYDLAKLVAQV